MKRIWIALIAAAALAGCSAGADSAAADQAVTQFHSQLDGARYDEIINTAAPDFRNAKPVPDLVRFLEAVHLKLGPLKTTTKEGWRENYMTSGHSYVATYHSTFAKGEATETFTYRVDGANATLAGYFINSDALITN
jgi:hypothetical protein